MLLAIAAAILVFWLLGVVAWPVAGSMIHVLLVVALIAVLLHYLGARYRRAIG